MRRALLAILVLACDGVPARPQWTVIVATDAPLPQFGDRVIIEVLDMNGALACTDCARQFGVGVVGQPPVSFGIVDEGARLRVRGRLFRSSLIGSDGTPASTALIDRTVSLPVTTTDLHVSLVLPMSCFGVPAQPDVGISCDPKTGLLAPELPAPEVTGAEPVVGSWGPAAVVDCPSAPPPGMTCIPGGAFLLGSPVTTTITGSDAATTPEHLVTLSPFYLDDHELTVAEYVALAKLHPSLPVPLPQGAGVDQGQYCTYQGTESSMPLTCVNHDDAATICASEGKRLPTEAEWEYAAGNTNEETPFPWGVDTNVCAHAVLARGDIKLPSVCRIGSVTLPVGPVAGGSSGDMTQSGVLNLAGNVGEWAADAFASYADPCWSSGTTLLTDPLCATSSSGEYALRGGNWTLVPFAANVTVRWAASPAFASGYVGMRCASN